MCKQPYTKCKKHKKYKMHKTCMKKQNGGFGYPGIGVINTFTLGISGYGNPVNSAIFSPDSSMVATAHGNSTIKTWNSNTGQLVNILAGHDIQVVGLEYSPDGRKLLSFSSDYTAKLWDANTGKLLATTPEYEDDISSIAFSPDGTKIAITSKTLQIWNSTMDKLIAETDVEISSHITVTFSPDSSKILTSSYGFAQVWNAKTCELIHYLRHKEYAAVYTAQFSNDGMKIATSSSDGTAKLWSIGGRIIHTLLHSDIQSATFSPDGSVLLTSNTNSVKKWNVKTGKLIQVFNDVGKLEIYSPDGGNIITINEHQLKLLDSETGRVIQTLNHNNYVTSACFSPDNLKLVTSSEDNTAKLWIQEPTRVEEYKLSRMNAIDTAYNTNKKVKEDVKNQWGTIMKQYI